MNSFSGQISQQEWMIAPETQKVMDALREGGGDARFVGGCVRNALSNRKVLDIDIATPLVPEEVMARLTRHKIPYVPTGLKHGTVTAIVDGHPFEITTLRLDVATFGRHAEVKFTDDWAADASRRDFTINAMFCTPEGQIFDPFGGVKDLRLGRVRFVGDAGQRIQEDVLRILRFFRFYAHFGKGEPDAAAIAACTTAAPEISKLSAERIRQEVLKLLESDHCPAVWQLMFRCGIAQDVLPAATRVTFLENLVNLEAEHHSPAFPLRRLAAVLDVGLCQVEKASQALRLSNDQVAQLRDMMNPPAEVSVEMAEATVRRYTYTLGNDTMRNLLLLSAARSSRKGNLDQLYHVATTFRAPRFPLTGADVLNLGYTPGPEVGRVLAGIESWWIDQDFSPGRTECLQKLSGEFPRKPR